MSIMSLSRIKTLREALDAECIDLEELSEIETAFESFPTFLLRDERENAMATDMLDELETLVSPTERAIYDWVELNFGENEAKDPSWDIRDLANHLEKKGFKNALEQNLTV